VGDDDYNLELSQQRAASVRDYLLSKGLDRNKIVTTDMGENMPVASNSTPEGLAENRRVEILLLGRIKE
jgi:OOP family OmpA-OmpF porin